MCGFVGFTGELSGGEERLRCISDMTRAISHRGPDESGAYTDKSLTLGFARLKIIDLENGRQPMLSECGRYVLCFNGEIYNYRELAEELRKDHGISFRTESDTEVLLDMLIRYGERALERLRGMYAFCFYDRERESFILARDPFGIKPLYYGEIGETFMFASEIKALLSHPQFRKEFNSEVLPYYLQFQYVPTEETAFKGVKRLAPGHILRFCKGNISLERYFYPTVYGRHSYLPYGFFCGRDGESRKPMPYVKSRRQAVKMISEAVSGSVKAHLVSDVPLGTFLSGGVDSGYITALAKPEMAFTVGFPSYGFDERVVAAATAEGNGVKLVSVEADADDFFEAVGKVQYHSDEPYANLSAIPLYLLSKRAKKQESAVLSGECADELFGGYEWYFDSVIGKIYRMLPEKLRRYLAKNGGKGRIGEFLRRNTGNARREYIGQAKITDAEGAAALLKEPYKAVKEPYGLTGKYYSQVRGASLLESKKYLDTALWLPYDILLKADKMTMASSLELRVPYLDLSVLSAAEGLSDKLLVRGKIGKRVFREAAAEVLGKEKAYRKKKGFPVPFREWIRQKKYAEILEIAFTGAIAERFFQTERLKKLLQAHVSGEENNARVLYTVFAFIKWYEIYFENGAKNSPSGADKLKNDTVPMISAMRREKRNEKMDGDHTRF